MKAQEAGTKKSTQSKATIGIRASRKVAQAETTPQLPLRLKAATPPTVDCSMYLDKTVEELRVERKRVIAQLRFDESEKIEMAIEIVKKQREEGFVEDKIAQLRGDLNRALETTLFNIKRFGEGAEALEREASCRAMDEMDAVREDQGERLALFLLEQKIEEIQLSQINAPGSQVRDLENKAKAAAMAGDAKKAQVLKAEAEQLRLIEEGKRRAQREQNQKQMQQALLDHLHREAAVVNQKLEHALEVAKRKDRESVAAEVRAARLWIGECQRKTIAACIKPVDSAGGFKRQPIGPKERQRITELVAKTTKEAIEAAGVTDMQII